MGRHNVMLTDSAPLLERALQPNGRTVEFSYPF